MGLQKAMYSKNETYLQYLASLCVTVAVLTRVKHPQSNAVQQDYQHAGPLEPCGKQKLRNSTQKIHEVTEYKHNIRPEYKQMALLQPRYRIQAIGRHIFNNI